MRSKPGALNAIRKQVASQARLRHSALAGSGYRKLQSRNAVVDGTMPVIDRTDEERMINAATARTRNKIMFISISENTADREQKRVAKPRVNPPTPNAKPAAPVTEHWAPAGGVPSPGHDAAEGDYASATLAVARIAGWRLDTFTESLKALIERHMEHEEITVVSRDIGGEIVVDVYVRFRSEMVAQAAKGDMDGEMLDGRKLRLGYA